ncbi:MAG: ABC transporter permease subunit [Lachnospiraceae bacterium]|nr:ABC transporter permease subunit [Lachnospiraceae bacterium]
MIKIKRLTRPLGLLLCALMLTVSAPLTALAAPEPPTDAAAPTTKATFDDLAGKRAAVMTGTPQADFVQANIKDVQLSFYNSMTDMAMAVDQGREDFFVNSTVAFRILSENYPDLGYVDQVLIHFDMGAIFPMSDKGEALKAEFDAFVNQIKADGTLDELSNYWLYPKQWQPVDLPASGDKGTLRMALSSAMKPYAFVLDGGYAGLDVAVVAAFCRENGYALEITDLDFAGVISGIAAEKFDLAAGQISYTADRAKSVLFSEYYAAQEMVPVVRADAFPEGAVVTGKAISEGEGDNAILNGTAGGSGNPISENGTSLLYNNLDELSKCGHFANITGTSFDIYIKEINPNARISYYDGIIDAVMAVAKGKAEACLADEPIGQYAVACYDNLAIVPEKVRAESHYFVTQKSPAGEARAADFNAWLAERKADGTLDEMKAFWCSTADPTGRIDYSALTGENGTLKVSVILESRPGTYIFNNEIYGYTAELPYRYALDRGYDLEFTLINPGALASAVASGKADFVSGFLSKTEERAETMLFTDSIYEGGIVCLTRKVDAAATSGSGLLNSIRRTLIDEDRWKMVLSGVGVTLVITIFGFALANILGALFCAMMLSKNRALRVIADAYSRIMQGTPMVVILMILYYIVFGKYQISGIIVSILGFGIASGAYMAQTFAGGIMGIDHGQTEAALALGFTKRQAFLDIVLPQAVRIMLPGYFSQLISLMKGTAVVGYVAVADLTKVGDIIRSSTFEPFVPLILVALIYFSIACILLSILKAIQKRLAPKRMTEKAAENAEPSQPVTIRAAVDGESEAQPKTQPATERAAGDSENAAEPQNHFHKDITDNENTGKGGERS